MEEREQGGFCAEEWEFGDIGDDDVGRMGCKSRRYAKLGWMRVSILFVDVYDFRCWEGARGAVGRLDVFVA